MATIKYRIIYITSLGNVIKQSSSELDFLSLYLNGNET